VLTAIGDVVEIAIHAFDKDGTELKVESAIWTSSDTTVIRLDQPHEKIKANVAPVGDGAAYARVELFGYRDSLLYTVQRIPRTVIVTPHLSYVLGLGATESLEGVRADRNGGPMPGTAIAWSSEHPEIAAVNATTGLVTGAGVGWTRIIARTDTVSGSAIVVVRAGPLRWTALGAGRTDTCGLAVEGDVLCWGAGYDGELGDSGLAGRDSTIPFPVAGGRRYVSLAVGASHACALTSGGLAYCWGSNGSTQAGAPRAKTSFNQPTLVPGVSNFTAIAAGFSTSCGLTADSLALCWGMVRPEGTFCGDELGTDSRCSAAPVVMSSLHFADLSVGVDHLCGVAGDGQAYCWLNNYYGQLGDGTGDYQASPTATTGTAHFTRISAGVALTCGASGSGQVQCWGLAEGGQVGVGNVATSCAGVPVSPSLFVPPWGTGGPAPCQTSPALITGSSLVSVSSGSGHACGLTASGSAYCWGSNMTSQLGRDQVPDRCNSQFEVARTSANNRDFPCARTPVAVETSLQFSSVVAGWGNHTCALSTSGVAYCWGQNLSGQLGDNTKIPLGDGSRTGRAEPRPVYGS
jgi:alpha-tubulin suppressor-like RCC1 family protein